MNFLNVHKVMMKISHVAMTGTLNSTSSVDKWNPAKLFRNTIVMGDSDWTYRHCCLTFYHSCWDFFNNSCNPVNSKLTHVSCELTEEQQRLKPTTLGTTSTDRDKIRNEIFVSINWSMNLQNAHERPNINRQFCRSFAKIWLVTST